MNNLLHGITNKVIENYKLVKNKLRFDGEYINHFASLIFRDNEEIDIDKIKKIRKYIKLNTNKMSSFRGDMLYMLSILISKEENCIDFSDRVINISEQLKDNDFKDGNILVLSAYALAKHSKSEDEEAIIKDMKRIYITLKNQYSEFTNEEDYLVCALIAIESNKNKVNIENSGTHIQNIFDYLSDLDSYSKNDLQGIASSLLLNNNSSAHYEIKKLIKIFNNEGMRIGDEVLPLIGAVSREENTYEYLRKVKQVTKYLCEEEGEYAYYMDKTFRTLISIVIVEMHERYNNFISNEYLEELLCFSIYSFLVSKKQGLFEEVLA